MEMLQVNGNQVVTASGRPVLLRGYVAGLMQGTYARLFQGSADVDVERLMQSFALQNCRPHAALVEIVKQRLKEEK